MESKETIGDGLKGVGAEILAADPGDKEQIVPEDVYDALANSGVEFEHRLAGE